MQHLLDASPVDTRSLYSDMLTGEYTMKPAQASLINQLPSHGCRTREIYI